MAPLSFCSQFETNLMSNRKVIRLLLQLKSAKAHGKNYIKVKPHLVAIFLRNRVTEVMGDTAKGGLRELFTVILCAPKILNVNNIVI